MGFSEKEDVKKAFALLDLDSKSLRNIYEKIGWEESKKYNIPIYFTDYGKMVGGHFKPTLWQVMELPEEKISRIAEKTNRYHITT